MAAGSCIYDEAPFNNSKLSDENKCLCICCDKWKWKMFEVTSELQSLLKTAKILQEERSETPQGNRLSATDEQNIQFNQSSSDTTVKLMYLGSQELLNETSSYTDIEALQRDATELTAMFYKIQRPTVKEVIQMDTDILLAKIGSLKVNSGDQHEAESTWKKVVGRKCKNNVNSDKNVVQPIPVIANPYNILHNETYDKTTLYNAGTLKVLNPVHR
jgi:hypothetical protein